LLPALAGAVVVGREVQSIHSELSAAKTTAERAEAKADRAEAENKALNEQVADVKTDTAVMRAILERMERERRER
jgi:hypothetical protein